jgi:hypothetical protein
MADGSEVRRDDILITVDQDGEAGWQSRVTAAGGSVTFEAGPAVPPIGNGSVCLFTGTEGDQGAEMRLSTFDGTLLRDLTDLRYWTYDQINNGQQWPYIILQIDLTNEGNVDDLLFFEPGFQTPATGNPSLPDQGLPVLNTWQDWNALAGGWWSLNALGGLTPGNSVGPIFQYNQAVGPSTARIVGSAAGGGIRVVHGFASPADVFQGCVDAFSIQTMASGITTTFNFEPLAGPPTPSPMPPQGRALLMTRPLFSSEGTCGQGRISRPFIGPVRRG